MVWFFSRTSQSLDMLGILQEAGTAPLTNPLGLEPLFQRELLSQDPREHRCFNANSPGRGGGRQGSNVIPAFSYKQALGGLPPPVKRNGAHPNLLLAGGPVGSRTEKGTGRWERGRGLGKVRLGKLVCVWVWPPGTGRTKASRQPTGPDHHPSILTSGDRPHPNTSKHRG